MFVSSNSSIVRMYQEEFRKWIRQVLLGPDPESQWDSSPVYAPYHSSPLTFPARTLGGSSYVILVALDGSSGNWSWRSDSALGYNFMAGRLGSSILNAETSDVWMWMAIVAQLVRYFPEEQREEMRSWLQVSTAKILAQQIAGVNTSVFETVQGAPIHKIAVDSSSNMWAEVKDSSGQIRWLDANGHTVPNLPNGVRVLEV